jgi:branched-chain amino acid aminotransferase
MSAPPKGVVMIDGELFEPEKATVTVYDRGFLYGDAVFETLRTYGGRPFALSQHLARLRRSAALVFIQLPIEEAALASEVESAVAAAGNAESYARVIITRGSGPIGLDPDLARFPLRVILVEPLRPPSRDAYAQGIGAALIPTRRVADATHAAGAKLGNYLPNLLALREAKLRGAEEALVVDASGRVIEGASSNVFCLRRGTLSTPPEDAGILAGITRALVLEVAGALALPTKERELYADDLYGADEVFITSSIRELLPIVRVDDHAIGAGTPGDVTRALHRAFRARVGDPNSMPWE